MELPDPGGILTDEMPRLLGVVAGDLQGVSPPQDPGVGARLWVWTPHHWSRRGYKITMRKWKSKPSKQTMRQSKGTAHCQLV